MINEFTYSFSVQKKDIDHLDHVSNIVYVHWLLNAAQKHWAFLSNDTLNSKFVWVVLRHEIDYLFSAKLNDVIIINTWVEKSEGAKSERIVEIKKADKLLAKGKTTWCLLDKHSMKPARIPEEIIEIFN